MRRGYTHGRKYMLYRSKKMRACTNSAQVTGVKGPTHSYVVKMRLRVGALYAPPQLTVEGVALALAVRCLLQCIIVWRLERQRFSSPGGYKGAMETNSVCLPTQMKCLVCQAKGTVASCFQLSERTQ